ncbi:MAG: hypothetical protein M1818_002930 [Claussenomyces sp. TS43310]|nr:MAG: hypothetical protein M1818_002930 [Claussenomyces sp. TS43310]
MISTRTRTGALERARYDYATLKLKGEKVGSTRSKPARGKGVKQTTDSRRSTSKYTVIQVGKDKSPSLNEDVIEPAAWTELSFEDTAGFDQEIPDPSSEDISEGVNFAPPCAFGAIESIGRSAIQRAADEIRIWEIIRSHHEQHLPRVVPMIELRIREAREARARLDDNEANSRIVDESMQNKGVENRITVLEKFLAESQFEPERENMRCAIEAYRSRQIKYCSHYTLIYAGRIVDTAETYGAFTVDRTRRLDDYAKSWGPHWLWYERGLKCPPASAPRMSRCAEIAREVSATGLGQYWIKQCFWKRAGWVMRMPQTQMSNPVSIPKKLSAQWLASHDGRVYCQQEGPRLVFASLLDSGATFPSLHPADFPLLGIDPALYSAQSIEECITANGNAYMKCFEMYVTVVDEECKDLVDPDDAVWPYHGKYIGGLCPVLQVVGLEHGAPAQTAEGFEYNHRLSGLLPFVACYTSLCPTINTVFLGEDRKDVLGAQRMPGQRRWDISMPSTEPLSRQIRNKFGDPKVRFIHNRGQIMDADRDDLSHASSLIYNIGLPNEQRLENNPKAQCDETRARAACASRPA